MLKDTRVYVVDPDALTIRPGVFVDEPGEFYGRIAIELSVPRVMPLDTVYLDGDVARDVLAGLLRERAAMLRRQADDLESRALHLTLSSPRTPGD